MSAEKPNRAEPKESETYVRIVPAFIDSFSE